MIRGVRAAWVAESGGESTSVVVNHSRMCVQVFWGGWSEAMASRSSIATFLRKVPRKGVAPSAAPAPRFTLRRRAVRMDRHGDDRHI